MDVQLQELIDKIKKDGVVSAETTAATIIAEAENKARAIISEAETKADATLKSAQVEIKRLEKAGSDAIKHAARNVLISFRDGINAQLCALINIETEKAYSADMLKTLIPETVKNWTAKSDADSLTVLLSEKDIKTLETQLLSALKAEVAKGLTVKADETLGAGFRIGVNDGSAYYDFSAQAVAELFSTYLNPRTAEILKEAVAEKGSIE